MDIVFEIGRLIQVVIHLSADLLKMCTVRHFFLL